MTDSRCVCGHWSGSHQYIPGWMHSGVCLASNCRCRAFAARTVPSNPELAVRAREERDREELTLRDAVRRWLDRHMESPWGPRDNLRERWLDWASDNFCADPELRVFFESEHIERESGPGNPELWT